MAQQTAIKPAPDAAADAAASMQTGIAAMEQRRAEEIRIKALELSIASWQNAVQRDETHYLERARKFEDYLRGDPISK